MRIYVASSWRNTYQQRIVQLLTSLGHEVYDFRNPGVGNHGFSWSDIDPNWLSWTPEQFVQGLQHPIAKGGFNLDYAAMQWADVLVLVLPCGRSAHLEAGWAMGQGKPVVVYIPEQVEPELMYLCGSVFACSEQQLVTELQRVSLTC